MLLDALADTEAQTILNEVVTKAKEGDLKAAEIVLARVWPPRKGRLVRFNLAPSLTPETLPEALAQVIEAAANGILTLDEAASFASLLDAQRKAYELGELTRRIQLLEARLARPGKSS